MYQYNQKNQLLYEKGTIGTKWFTYDAQGGILEQKSTTGVRRFVYNSRHQQTRVETEDGQVQENRYDTEDLRFELLENGKRTNFVYHNGELLHEEGGEEKQTSYHLGVGIDAFKKGQETYYYHRDEQLSTALITGRNSRVQNSYQYDAFGNRLDSVEQVTNRFCYTGQQYDELTAQYYLRARYYNPVLGRFMQEDVYQGDGLNLYSYCKNNPVIYYDPSGYGNREQYMGGTLRLNSPGGRIVLDRTLKNGLLDISGISDADLFKRIQEQGFSGIQITKKLKNEIKFLSSADNEQHLLSESNMSHIRNAVDAWNEEFYKLGPKSKEVREFMQDPDNYYLETEHANKSDGQKLGTYRDPETPNEEEVKSSACN